MSVQLSFGVLIHKNADIQALINTYESHKADPTIDHIEPICSYIHQSNNTTPPYCCLYNIKEEFALRCLPHFIIAGVQKGGTTALSAYLSNVTEIYFSPKKEIHFFDRNSKNHSNIPSYLDYLKPFYLNTSMSIPLYGESTPAYIANMNACERIHNMIPNIKIILLLRNPVDRAYSEYMMKKR